MSPHLQTEKIDKMENRTFGYCRITDSSQNELRQLIALKEFGIAERDINIDKQSGKDFDRKRNVKI